MKDEGTGMGVGNGAFLVRQPKTTRIALIHGLLKIVENRWNWGLIF